MKVFYTMYEVLSFEYNGKKIKYDSTPNSIGLINGDIMHAIDCSIITSFYNPASDLTLPLNIWNGDIMITDQLKYNAQFNQISHSLIKKEQFSDFDECVPSKLTVTSECPLIDVINLIKDTIEHKYISSNDIAFIDTYNVYTVCANIREHSNPSLQLLLEEKYIYPKAFVIDLRKEYEYTVYMFSAAYSLSIPCIPHRLIGKEEVVGIIVKDWSHSKFKQNQPFEWIDSNDNNDNKFKENETVFSWN